MRLLHVACAQAWARARADGTYRGSTRGAELDDVGFVHACTASQLPGVLDRFYAADTLEGQLLLVIDVPACEAAGSPLRWEAADGATEPFPHVLGPIPVPAVAAVLPLVRGDDGGLVQPDLQGLEVLAGPVER